MQQIRATGKSSLYATKFHKVLQHFARSNRYAKFVSFEFRNNRLSIKTKARQLHKLKYVSSAGDRKLPDQNRKRTEELPQQVRKEDDVKKGKSETEKEKKNIRHVVAKVVYHNGMLYRI